MKHSTQGSPHGENQRGFIPLDSFQLQSLNIPLQMRSGCLSHSSSRMSQHAEFATDYKTERADKGRRHTVEQWVPVLRSSSRRSKHTNLQDLFASSTGTGRTTASQGIPALCIFHTTWLLRGLYAHVSNLMAKISLLFIAGSV